MNDVYGKGLKAYWQGKHNAKFKVESDKAETEYWPIKVFFHTWNEMSEIERKALALCEGLTLDVGAGSGSHVLWLQENGINVRAIDISEGAVEVMRERGVAHASVADYYTYESEEKYDTLLMLMNGAGIAGKMNNLAAFLTKAYELLKDGGQLIMDSSDILYLYEDEDGSVMLDLNDDYYGELEYVMSYAGEKGESFSWLFVDYDTLEAASSSVGFKCEKVYEDDSCQYLVRLRK